MNITWHATKEFPKATKPRTETLSQIYDYGLGMSDAEVKAHLVDAMALGLSYYQEEGFGVRYQQARLGPLTYRRTKATHDPKLRSMRVSAEMTLTPWEVPA